MSSLTELSHHELVHYINMLEGLQRTLGAYKKHFSWLADMLDQMDANLESVRSEAINEREARIASAFAAIQIGDRVEYRYPAPNPVPANFDREVTPDGFVVQTGKITQFTFTTTGPMMVFEQETSKQTSMIKAQSESSTWRKLD